MARFPVLPNSALNTREVFDYANSFADIVDSKQQLPADEHTVSRTTASFPQQELLNTFEY